MVSIIDDFHFVHTIGILVGMVLSSETVIGYLDLAFRTVFWNAEIIAIKGNFSAFLWKSVTF